MVAFWEFLRSRIWALSAGIALAAAASLLGPSAIWGLLALSVAVALIDKSIFPGRAGPVHGPEPRAAEGLAGLPPLTRLLLEQLPMPVLLLDESERVLFVNEPMRSLLGTGALRQHVSTVLRNPDLLQAIDSTVRDGEPVNVPFILPVPIERHFQAYTARINAMPPATALLLHDLTAIKRGEQMRADFVANASHELRTPLAAVSGFIDTLRGHAREDEAARERFLGIMSVEAARMRRLIDDLLSLSRVEMSEHVPPVTPVALETVLREAAAALTPLAAAERIAVEVSAAPDLPKVTGDRDQLAQLFQNLIHNAIKYGRPDGHVWVSLGLGSDGQLVAAVRDDGEGIAPGVVPRLTERFYRVDVKRSREKGGTGLGLAIVKHIVSRHQGRLSIESRPGEGSCFTVQLPPAENGQKAPGAPPVMEML